MGKRKKVATGAQVREEMRKLNLIGKSEIRRSFDEEAATRILSVPDQPFAGDFQFA